MKPRKFFDANDFYTVDKMLKAKHDKNLIGLHNTTSKLDIQSTAILIINGRVQTSKEYTRLEIIYSLAGYDLNKFLVSAIFWTINIANCLSSNSINWLRDLIADIMFDCIKSNRLDERHKICDYVFSWKNNVLAAATVYLLKYLPRSSSHHYVITCSMARNFLGGDGLFFRGNAFGVNMKNISKDFDKQFHEINEIPEGLENGVEHIKTVCSKRKRLLGDYLALKDFVFEKYDDVRESASLVFEDVVELMKKVKLERSIKNLVKYKDKIFTKDNLIVYPRLRRLAAIVEEYKLVPRAPKPQPQIVQPLPSAPETNPLDCTICFANRINMRLDPCGHIYCKPCSETFVKCPQCRTSITKIDPIYIP